MAENIEKKILVDVQLKNSSLLDASAKSRAELIKLQEEKKKLDASFKAGTLTIDEYSEALEKNRLEQVGYNAALKSNQKLLELSKKQVDSAEGSYNKLSAQYEETKIKLNAMSAADRLATDEGKALEQESFAIYQQMIKLQEATGKHTLSVGDYAKGTRGLIDALQKENIVIEDNIVQLKQQRIQVGGFGQAMKINAEAISQIDSQLEQYNQQLIKNDQLIQEATHQVESYTAAEEANRKQIGFTTNAVKVYADTLDGAEQEIKDLEVSMRGMKLGSKQFEEAQKRADDLRLKVQQAKGKVDEFGEKEPKNKIRKAFDDSAEAAAGVVAAVQLLDIAFGKSEKTAEAQARILKLVAIQQGIVNVAKAVGAVRDLAAAAATKIAAGAQVLYAAVVGKSTGAMKLFKIALAGTGIGAIVILLGELIFNFEAVSKKVEKAKNAISDWTAKMSNGNKTVAQFVNIITTLGSPLGFVIQLVNDFSGTLSKLQESVNGIFDSLAERFGKFGSVIKAGLAPFNFFIGALKSLDTGAKKYKPTIETLTKTYENFTNSVDRKRIAMQKEIDMAKAQGASESKLANMQKKLLHEVSVEQQKALDFAIGIKDKLVKQNGKLTDEQEKLFNEVQDKSDEALIAEKQFQHDLNKAAADRAKERLDIERNLQAELNALRIGAIRDEFEQRRAQLDEQLRLDTEASDLAIKENVKKFGEGSKIVQQLREKDLLIKEKYADDSFKIDVEQADRETDLLIQTLENEAAIKANSFDTKTKQLADDFALQEELAKASFVLTAKTEKGKTEQLKQELIKRKEAEIKYFQDQLKLVEQFALEDKLLSPEEAENVKALNAQLEVLGQQLNDLKDQPTIPEDIGLDKKTVQDIQFAGEQIMGLINTISSVLNADADYRKQRLDDNYNYQAHLIEQSAISEEEKEKKIAALNKKTAMEKYQIDLEQFRANKALSIINATIAGVLAVVNSLANTTLPFPASLIAPAIIGASTAAQVGIIAATPEPAAPQFATGVIGLQGPGTGTSDSINAKLSKGESVLTEKATAAFHPILAQMEMAVGNKPNYNIGSGKFASGLIGVSKGVSSGIDPLVLAKTIANEMQKVQVVTKLTDINVLNKKVVMNKIKATA